MKNFDSYYDPPDEEELPCCEECGHELQEGTWYQGKGMKLENLYCPNDFCPAKFHGRAKDMADMILVLLEQIDRLKIEKNILENTLRDYQK